MTGPSGFKPVEQHKEIALRLESFDFVRQLSEAGRAQLVQGCSSAHFESLQRLLSSGDQCAALLLVERGDIRVFKRAESGREILLYRVAPGESCVLGTTCLLRGHNYPAEAEAAPGTDALVVEAEVFRELYDREPAVRQFVMNLYAHRLEELMLLVEEVAFHKVDERLASYLCRAARVDETTWRPIEMSHEQLAAQLGTAREVVSRVLNQFAEEGSVVLERRRVRVIDPEHLLKMEKSP